MSWAARTIGKEGVTVLEQFEEVMTTGEACEALRIGKNALYELLINKKLKGFRNGRVWRIPKQAVIEFIREQASLK